MNEDFATLTRASNMPGHSPNRWLALLGALVVTAVVALAFGGAWTALPEPMASHWGPTGKPDGAAPKVFLVALVLAPVWILAGATALTPSRPARATLITTSSALTGLFSVMAWSLVSLNRGVTEWRSARVLPMSHLGWLALATLGLGAIAAIALRPHFKQAEPGVQTPSLTLAGGERAVWLSSARNRWLWWLLAMPLPLVLLWRHTTPVATTVAVVGAVVTLALADAFSWVRVTVDHNGVDIRCGHLGLLRRRVALRDVDHAEVFDLVPLAHGGWGYRGSLRLMKRAAIVVRGGSALRLALRDGKQLSVTVDDAASGASLINGMVRLR